MSDKRFQHQCCQQQTDDCRLFKLKFIEAVSSWHQRDIVATMSLTCHEEIGRVGRVARGCYEDASDLSATSRACRARGIWRTTPTHGQTGSSLLRSSPLADQSGKGSGTIRILLLFLGLRRFAYLVRGVRATGLS